MEAASINKLGAPDLEVVQEYRKKNPKKFTNVNMKNSSAVPGRRMRVNEGGNLEMSNTMPAGFS